jgi:hypothetical protein
MNKTYFIILLIVLGITAGASAAIITVNSAGGANQTTVSAAITAAVANDTIRIIGVGPYDEVITVNKPLTIEGFGVRPNLCVQDNAASPSGANDGFVVTGFTGDCVLKNLNIIPSRTTPPADDGILINPGTGPQTLNLTMDGLVVCPNDGTDNPVTLDGSAEVDLTGKTPFGDDGMSITSVDSTSIVIANINDCIFSNNRNGGSNDGMVIFPTAGGGSVITIGPGCVISHNNRIGIQYAGAGANILIRGTADNRVKIFGNGKTAVVGQGAITMFNGTGDIDQCIIRDNGAAGIATLTGTALVCDGLVNVSNTIIANNGHDGIYMANGATVQGIPVTIDKVTFCNNTQSPFEIAAAEIANQIVFTDCILAGNGTDDISATANAFLNNAAVAVSTSNINYSALVLAGGVSYSLATSSIDGVEGAGITIIANSITADPVFASTDPASSNYFDVTNYAYGAAGTAGAPLAGGANFIGVPLVLSAGDTTILPLGATQDFNASGGIGSYTWALSNDSVGGLSATTGSSVTFTASSIGEVVLTLTDAGPPEQQKTTTILILPTSAPLFIDAKENKEVRFEIFE